MISRISVLGSTGSIGVNTLDVIRRHPARFRVPYLATNRNIRLLAEQIDEFLPAAVAVTDLAAAEELRKLRPRTTVLAGVEGLTELATYDDYDTLVGAIVGFAGLRPTIEAARKGKKIALANKEALVVAGEILTAIAAGSGTEILPIDSEHSAIYQCLVGEDMGSIKRIMLTASGGPFREWTKEALRTATLEQALRHPNWVMGKKITIDSATLMNKGLEVIEAKWLFDVPLEKIDVIVHPQSIVHSMVEFTDGSVKAQLGAPDMRLPIQYALLAPERLDESYDRLDLLTTRPLEFFEPDPDRFPALQLAREAGERGGLFPCVLNASNEIAVDAFLNGDIGFTMIPELIREAMESAPDGTEAPFQTSTFEEVTEGLDRIFHTDARTRMELSRKLETRTLVHS